MTVSGPKAAPSYVIYEPRVYSRLPYIVPRAWCVLPKDTSGPRNHYFTRTMVKITRVECDTCRRAEEVHGGTEDIRGFSECSCGNDVCERCACVGCSQPGCSVKTTCPECSTEEYCIRCNASFCDRHEDANLRIVCADHEVYACRRCHYKAKCSECADVRPK